MNCLPFGFLLCSLLPFDIFSHFCLAKLKFCYLIVLPRFTIQPFLPFSLLLIDFFLPYVFKLNLFSASRLFCRSWTGCLENKDVGSNRHKTFQNASGKIAVLGLDKIKIILSQFNYSQFWSTAFQFFCLKNLFSNPIFLLFYHSSFEFSAYCFFCLSV